MRLAIVIPVLDEHEARLRDCLRRAVNVADAVWTADASALPTGVRIAEEMGARPIVCAPGRGAQINAGCQAALAAGAEILLVQHADTRLPESARAEIEEAVAGGASGGGFLVRFDAPGMAYRLGSRLVNLRTRITRCPLGDQAQFLTADAYRALSGFSDWPILEDLDLARRMKRHGRVAVLEATVTTSARRFQEGGILSTLAVNYLIWALYFVGVPPTKLASLYPARAPQREDPVAESHGVDLRKGT